MSLVDDTKKDKQRGLFEEKVHGDAMDQFLFWFNEHKNSLTTMTDDEASGMCLATSTSDGVPSARMVLLKGFSKTKGFRFFTNYQSRKGQELSANNRCALLFYWPKLERQIRVEGRAVLVSSEESDVYFQSRPLMSQINATVSKQSQAVSTRQVLLSLAEEKRAQVEREGLSVLPRPQNWGGFDVEPQVIEFWQGSPFRLHDRLRYTRTSEIEAGEAGSQWHIERLFP